LFWIKEYGRSGRSLALMDAEPPETPTEESVREALKAVDDPEAGMNIVELGLIYAIEATGERVRIRMTMTSPACPMGDYLAESARDAVRRAHPQVSEVDVELVWEPMWTPEMMSEEARNFFGWK